MKSKIEIVISDPFIPWKGLGDDTHPGPDRVKRWTSKVRTGCLTCRRRRVKCDEQKPTCSQCGRMKIECLYDSNPLSAKKKAARKYLSNPPLSQNDVNSVCSMMPVYGSLEEQRYLDVFISRSAPWIARYTDPTFFKVLLPQRSWHHPTLRHALVAVSMASEDFLSPSPSPKSCRRLWHYNQALHHLVTLEQKDQDMIMLACVLFFTHDNLMNQPKSAMVHFGAFLRMLTESRQAKIRRMEPYDLESTILHNMTFWGHVVHRSSAEPPNKDIIQKIRAKIADSTYTSSFKTLQETRREASLLMQAIPWAVASADAIDKDDPCSILLDELQVFAEKWYLAFSDQPTASREDCLIVQSYYLVFCCVIEAHRPNFMFSNGSNIFRLSAILDNLELIDFSNKQASKSKGDLVMPLVPLIGEVIRQSSVSPLRPRGLKLLKSLNRFETHWSTQVMASMVESFPIMEHYPQATVTAHKILRVVEDLKDDESK